MQILKYYLLIIFSTIVQLVQLSKKKSQTIRKSDQTESIRNLTNKKSDYKKFVKLEIQLRVYVVQVKEKNGSGK